MHCFSQQFIIQKVNRLSVCTKEQRNGVITLVSMHVSGGSKAYLIEFCQLVPKQEYGRKQNVLSLTVIQWFCYASVL